MPHPEELRPRTKPKLAPRQGEVDTKRRTNEDRGDRLGAPAAVQHPNVKMAQASGNRAHCFLHLPGIVHGEAHCRETMLGNLFFPIPSFPRLPCHPTISISLILIDLVPLNFIYPHMMKLSHGTLTAFH